MAKKWLINALMPLGLAAAFSVFFMTTKHDAALSTILPFAFDPYDAISSFAVETAIFLAILSCVRTFRLSRKDGREGERHIFLARAQMGVVLAVLLTLVGDAVAMVRHLPQWTGHPATNELVLLCVGMVVLASSAGILVAFSVCHSGFPRLPGGWKKGTLVFAVMVGLLAFYPENIIRNNIGELFTVVVGALLLFVPMWALGEVLLPYPVEKPEKKQGWSQWMVVLLVALGIGLIVVLSEATESGRGGRGISLFHALHVSFVYIGLEVAAVLIGYGVLKEQLGLFRRR